MQWRVPHVWPGATVVIVAGGPSLRDLDLSLLAARNRLAGVVRVITINDSWRVDPTADIRYFCDRTWWDAQMILNRTSLNKALTFRECAASGFWVTTANGLEDNPHVLKLAITGESGLETNPDGLRHGSNSGYQAINLAYHLGAKRIVLLGYDMHCDGNATHWHGDSEATAAGFSTTLKYSMLPHFQTLVEPLRKAGVEVINATPGSALTCWPYKPLADVLEFQRCAAVVPELSFH